MNNILVVGANSDLAELAVNQLVADNKNYVGLHYSNNSERIKKYDDRANVLLIQKTIKNEEDCQYIVDKFAERTGGEINIVIVLIGAIKCLCDWSQLSKESIIEDYFVNAIIPFMCAKCAIPYMKRAVGGGKIILVSTASAMHGGGRRTLGYGMAKSALECVVKRFAKDLAPENITVNAIAPGFFDTDSQIKFKSEEEIKRRSETIPLKRGGTKQEFAAILLFLVEKGKYITGQIINADGGDFI